MKITGWKPFGVIAAGVTSFLLGAAGVWAQDTPLRVVTVDRAPFSFPVNGVQTGFSINLIENVAQDLGRTLDITRVNSFPAMFDALEANEVDLAIANISITAEREARIDFSQPIFESGVQIMVPDVGQQQINLVDVIFTRGIALTIFAAFAMLFFGGLLMWAFERKRQPYFDRPFSQALFPSFWWALNLVVNGGFEERMPQSRFGRGFAVLLVVSSLFVVSAFVAQITTAMTVKAITGSIETLSDLETQTVGTTQGSTASKFLNLREIQHREYADLQTLLAEFEAGALDAVFFDGPILAYYIRTNPQVNARLVDRVFKPENYGIALPAGSTLREPIDRSLLGMLESGRYDEIRDTWFGTNN